MLVLTVVRRHSGICRCWRTGPAKISSTIRSIACAATDLGADITTGTRRETDSLYVVLNGMEFSNIRDPYSRRNACMYAF